MLLFLTVTSLALQTSVADTSPFRALPLPAPNGVRGASGAPGRDYWQQRADYVIRATLDTAGSLLRGSERIHYENHSPDTLRFVWVQIEQNIFAKNSVTYALNQPPLHFAGGAVFDFTGKGFIGGITIARSRPAARSISTSPGTSPCRPTAAAAWDGSARACTRSANGTRAWSYTTTCTAGIRCPTSAPASSISSTATSTSP